MSGESSGQLGEDVVNQVMGIVARVETALITQAVTLTQLTTDVSALRADARLDRVSKDVTGIASGLGTLTATVDAIAKVQREHQEHIERTERTVIVARDAAAAVTQRVADLEAINAADPTRMTLQAWRKRADQWLLGRAGIALLLLLPLIGMVNVLHDMLTFYTSPALSMAIYAAVILVVGAVIWWRL